MEAREMEPNYVNSRIGEKIKDLRNKNGLTQQELADRAELTKGYISQLERGQVAPSVVTLLELKSGPTRHTISPVSLLMMARMLELRASMMMLSGWKRSSP